MLLVKYKLHFICIVDYIIDKMLSTMYLFAFETLTHYKTISQAT